MRWSKSPRSIAAPSHSSSAANSGAKETITVPTLPLLKLALAFETAGCCLVVAMAAASRRSKRPMRGVSLT